MTNDERIEFLNEHPCNSRWDVVLLGRRWTVTTFYATGYGPTFTAALDDCIRVYREREAEWVAAFQCPDLSKRERKALIR